MNSEFQFSRMIITYLLTDADIIVQISSRRSYLSTADIGRLQHTAYLYTPSSQEWLLHFQMAFKKSKREHYFMLCENYDKIQFWFSWNSMLIPVHTTCGCFHTTTTDWTGGNEDQLFTLLALYCYVVPHNSVAFPLTLILPCACVCHTVTFYLFDFSVPHCVNKERRKVDTNVTLSDNKV